MLAECLPPKYENTLLTASMYLSNRIEHAYLVQAPTSTLPAEGDHKENKTQHSESALLAKH